MAKQFQLAGTVKGAAPPKQTGELPQSEQADILQFLHSQGHDMAVEFDLHIDQGTTFTQTFTKVLADGKTPQNLTGYTGRMMIRKTKESSDYIFDSDENVGTITISGALGKTIIALTDEITAAFPAPFEGVYDVELTDGSGNVSRLVQGEVIIDANVTR